MPLRDVELKQAPRQREARDMSGSRRGEVLQNGSAAPRWRGSRRLAWRMGCEIKGQTFNGLLVALETLCGPDARAKVLPHLDRELRLLVERGAVMASGWYDLRWYSELATGMAREFPDVSGLELGRIGMRHDINRFSRFVLSFASPAMLFKMSAMLMGMYFRGGATLSAVPSASGGVARFSGMDGACDATWQAICGAVVAFVELSGGKNVQSVVVAGGGDETFCELHVTWG